MKNTNDYEKEQMEEQEHDLVVLLLGFRGFCPFYKAAKEAYAKEEAERTVPKVKKPIRSEAEQKALLDAFYAAGELERTVSIANMAKVMGICPDYVRKKLNKYPERFEPNNGRVKLV